MGANPVGEVLRTAKGVMLGTTEGDNCTVSCGTVWKYVP